MPTRPKKPCAAPGCPTLIEAGTRHCDKHKKQEAQRYDRERGTAAQRGYGGRWQRARIVYLREHPLCVECEKQGGLTPATVVDHIKPHKGNRALFWDSSNWQALCKLCHDRKTVKEDGGFGHG